MADKFNLYTIGLDSPAGSAATITPNNGADMPVATRAVYIGGAGNLAAVTVDGQTVTFANLPAGMILPVRLARVLVTGTTATALVGMW